jgi:hypothetical protein
MKPRKLLKWLKRLVLGVILLPVAVIGLFLLKIPIQAKLVCEFDDGDRMVIRQDFLFQPVALFFRSVRDSAGYQVSVYYKPKYWIEGWKKNDRGIQEMIGFRGKSNTAKSYRNKYCSNFRKIDGVITAGDKYKLPGDGWQDVFYRRGHLINNLSELEHTELKKKILEMKLSIITYYTNNGSGLARIDASTLLYEEPLISISKGCYSFGHPACLVQGVLRSYSYDGGETWGPLELTLDSKLYEFGKPLYEQKGVARPVSWTGKSWFSR